MKFRRYYIFICLLFGHSLLFSQQNSDQWFFRRLNQERGLPVSKINCIAQDKEGFLWLGTNEGLYRYDGYGYKNFYYQTGKKDVMPVNQVSCIYIDRDGYMWVGTYQGGLVQMTGNSQEFYIYNNTSCKDFSYYSNRIADVKEDAAGNIWCSTQDGLFRINKQTKTVTAYRHETHPQLLANGMSNIAIDQSNRLWFGNAHGVQYLDLRSGTFYSRKNNPRGLTILAEDSLPIYRLFIDTLHQKIWYSTWQPANKQYDIAGNRMLVYLDDQGKPVRRYPLMGLDYFLAGDGALWMTTADGVYVMDVTNPSMNNRLRVKLDNKLEDVTIADAAAIRLNDGSTWIAGNGGIVYGTLNYFTDHDMGNPGSGILPLPNGRQLVATYGSGAMITDEHFKLAQHFIKNDFDKDGIWAMMQSRLDGKYYLASQACVATYDDVHKTYEYLSSPPFDVHGAYNSLFEDEDGWLWFSNYYNRFFKYHPITHAYKTFDIPGFGYPSQIVAIYKGSDHTLWLAGNESGLFRFDTKTEKISASFAAGKLNSNTIEQSEICFIQALAPHEYIIGYETRGFSIYNEQTGVFKHYNKSNGLVSSNLRGALVNDSAIWLASTNGLSRFNRLDETFENYGYDDGIRDNEITSLSLLHDGNIACATKDGFLVFDPVAVKYSSGVNRPVITGINVFGSKVTDAAIINGKTRLIAGYDDKLLAIEFLSLDYLKPGLIRYQYMLEGFDKDWQNLNNRNRTATYTNLTPGDYKFYVRASYQGNEWAVCEAPVLITVKNIFYKTWWFILCVIVLILGLLYLLYRNRINQLVRLQKMRSAISSDLHDEIGATLSSISIFSQMAKSLSKSDPVKSEEMLDRIGNRSRDMVEGMSDIVWSINPANDDMEKILLRMRTHAYEMLGATNTKLEWEVPESFGRIKLGMQQRKNFYLVFKEAVNNIVKYAQATEVRIVAQLDRNGINFSIGDNGRGFDIQTITRGNGLNNMEERARQLQGSLKISTSPDKGTSISLQFPI